VGDGPAPPIIDGKGGGNGGSGGAFITLTEFSVDCGVFANDVLPPPYTPLFLVLTGIFPGDNILADDKVDGLRE
jgi:hypothetical protein